MLYRSYSTWRCDVGQGNEGSERGNLMQSIQFLSDVLYVH